MLRSILPIALLVTSLPATDYWVSSLRGNDANPGTAAQPFKTLTKAFGAAKLGDRVLVLPGRYAPSTGENFPLVVADGVQVLGTNGRSCVIDAEFRTNVTNPKDPRVNPVQGNVLLLGSGCRFGYLGIVNAPRNPNNPGDYWWSIALQVDGSSGSSDSVLIDHCYLDEFSRGIFVGGPSGNHSYKNVRIENCVLSRFYVEAINATVNAGLAQSSAVVNCTVVAHRDPTTRKSFARACISFGVAAQFDVRNCVLKDADWAGVEAVVSAVVTSDHNCYHGNGANLRGVTKGARDLEVDPQLAYLPTLTETVDAHHSGAIGPLWNAGTNLPVTGGDIDVYGNRIAGTVVDIGADEFEGPFGWVVGVPRVGGTIHAGVTGTSNAPVFLAIA
ncbi:MAG: DUF1565 domain-containing protein, partial [Planctomycetes bacterium]|nr:DUF1565 domain-containing protein [Planctomycetota bacterium]